MKTRRPLILMILDGWGIGQDDAHNAIFQAKTPMIDYLLETYPNGPIGAAGEHIGLEAGHQGSTEMGHLIMSAGRNVLLPQMQVKESLSTGGIKKNAALVKAIEDAAQRGTNLHLIGLLSDAGVHSYDKMLFALMEMAADAGIASDKVLIHIFSDGRDTPPESLPTHVGRLQDAMHRIGVGVIASVQGRYFAMDRDHRWERVEKAYRLMVNAKGERTAADIREAISQAREADETDEFIQPTHIAGEGIADGDVVINFNYRVDREIEITKALIEGDFDEFERPEHPSFDYVGMFPYYAGMKAPVAFEREELKMQNILPQVLEREGLTQYRLTETEKWVYVTKIFNAMREEPFEGEVRHLIPSDKVATFDLKPEMQAEAIAEHLAEKMGERAADVYIVNICNADMIGHTGNRDAAIVGCEAIDRAIKIVYEELQRHNGVMLITADHGDAEVMWDYENDVEHTQHTDSFVPFILVDDERRGVQIHEMGALRDVAPTMLEILDIEQPDEMDGTSLIVS